MNRLERRRTFLPTREGWGFVAGSFEVDVQCSLEAMRSDFVEEALRRGYDSDSAWSLARALRVRTNDNQEDFGQASAHFWFVPPLERSRFIFELKYAQTQEYLHRRVKKLRLSSSQEVASLVGSTLNKFWLHEREHLLQGFYFSPDDFEGIWEEGERRSETAKRWGGVTALGIFTLTMLVGSRIPERPDAADFLLTAGFAAISGLAASFLVQARLKYLSYRCSRLETGPYMESERAWVRPQIFTVSVIPARAVP